MNQRTKILMGVAAVLAVIVAADQWRRASDSTVVQPVRRTADVEIAQESGHFLPDYTAFDAIGERPLFRPDRRPEPAPVVQIAEQTAPPVETTDTPPDFVIVGVVTGPDGRGAATVREGTVTRRASIPSIRTASW